MALGLWEAVFACHFANIGVEVMLLDIVPKEPNDAEKAKGLSIQHPAVRKSHREHSPFQQTLKANPAALYSASFANRIKLGNFDDNLSEINQYDWVIEVVVENLAIKKSLYEKVDAFRKAGTLITSNTSGIPIHLMAEGRSDDFPKTFLRNTLFQSSSLSEIVGNYFQHLLLMLRSLIS